MRDWVIKRRTSKAELIGEQFGKWTVIGLGEHPQKVLCRCKCGVEREVFYSNLTSGLSKSCGPYKCGLDLRKQNGGNDKWKELGKQKRAA